jgi:hypothetical protein
MPQTTQGIQAVKTICGAMRQQTLQGILFDFKLGRTCEGFLNTHPEFEANTVSETDEKTDSVASTNSTSSPKEVTVLRFASLQDMEHIPYLESMRESRATGSQRCHSTSGNVPMNTHMVPIHRNGSSNSSVGSDGGWSQNFAAGGWASPPFAASPSFGSSAPFAPSAPSGHQAPPPVVGYPYHKYPTHTARAQPVHVQAPQQDPRLVQQQRGHGHGQYAAYKAPHASPLWSPDPQGLQSVPLPVPVHAWLPPPALQIAAPVAPQYAVHAVHAPQDYPPPPSVWSQEQISPLTVTKQYVQVGDGPLVEIGSAPYLQLTAPHAMPLPAPAGAPYAQHHQYMHGRA